MKQWWQKILGKQISKGGQAGQAPSPRKAAARVLDPSCNFDEVEIRLEDTCLRLRRWLALDLPHEVSAYVPRAEIRHRRFADGKLVAEDEIILNSLTIVHAPRHPLAGPPPEGTLPPPAPPPPPYPSSS